MSAVETERWTIVCRSCEVPVERGLAALIEGVQVAVFRTFAGTLYAVGNQDPFCGAYVMSRGIVGSRGDVPTVASPMLKQVFDLRTGLCLDADLDSEVRLPVHAVREREGFVEVGVVEGAG